MCGIDGRVAEEACKRERRDANNFWGGCSGVDSPAVDVFAVAAAASAVAVASAESKVFWGSLSRSQTGEEWGRDVDAVLAFCFALLSSFECASWYSFTSSGAWRFPSGSQVLSLSGYPFHLIRYWSLRFCCW